MEGIIVLLNQSTLRVCSIILISKDIQSKLLLPKETRYANLCQYALIALFGKWGLYEENQKNNRKKQQIKI